MSFHIEADLSEWMNLLDRHYQVHPLVNEALNAVLEVGFVETQGIVHVISGRLKASGGSRSWTRGAEWHGEVKYDAVNNGRGYAEYERRRHGDHDFLAPMYMLDSKFADAMMASVRGA